MYSFLFFLFSWKGRRQRGQFWADIRLCQYWNNTEKIIMTLAKRRMLSSRMALEQQQEQWQEELNKQYG